MGVGSVLASTGTAHHLDAPARVERGRDPFTGRVPGPVRRVEDVARELAAADRRLNRRPASGPRSSSRPAPPRPQALPADRQDAAGPPPRSTRSTCRSRGAPGPRVLAVDLPLCGELAASVAIAREHVEPAARPLGVELEAPLELWRREHVTRPGPVPSLRRRPEGTPEGAGRPPAAAARAPQESTAARRAPARGRPVRSRSAR